MKYLPSSWTNRYIHICLKAIAWGSYKWKIYVYIIQNGQTERITVWSNVCVNKCTTSGAIDFGLHKLLFAVHESLPELLQLCPQWEWYLYCWVLQYIGFILVHNINKDIAGCKTGNISLCKPMSTQSAGKYMSLFLANALMAFILTPCDTAY